MNEHMGTLERGIEKIIRTKMEELDRPDLYRMPLIGSSRADDVRYEDLKKIVGPWHSLPVDILPDARSVISYFVPFTRQVADSPAGRDATALWGEAYVVINDYFEVINEAVCKFLRASGYSACSFAYVEDTPEGEDPRAAWALPPVTSWSHRSGAAVAGLGTFGVNRLLITEKGSAGRISTVFTSASLEFSEPERKVFCPELRQDNNGRCGRCIAECPAGALAAGSLDYAKCSRRCIEMEDILGRSGATVCGKCISVCPLSFIE